MLLLALGAGGGGGAAGGRGVNPITSENELAGSPGWERPASAAIEGYAGAITAAPGDSIELHVATRPAARYRVEIYRLGWYGGVGARRLVCVPACDRDEQGAPQSEPPIPSQDPLAPPIRAGWPVTDTVSVGAGWTSGYYLVEFVLTSGPDAGAAATTFFVVREPQREPASQLLVQVPVNTWQAYNQWGGKSLYDFGTTRAYRVSFDRPWGRYAQSPLWWEYQLVRFLEREGYDVSYQTDVDTHFDPQSLVRHRVVLTVGHGEYWTKEIRDAFDAALAAGTNLAFMGSNTAYWQVRYEDGGRTIFSYKSTYDPEPDPALKTTLFRELVPPRPECALMAVQHRWLRTHQEGPVDYTVSAPASDPWLSGTGFAPGDVLRDVVGDEWDGLNPWPAELCQKRQFTVLFHAENGPGADDDADAVRWIAPSGARVFASGAQRFAWGLDTWGTRGFGHTEDADPREQQFVRNMLDDLTRPAPPASVRVREHEGRVVIRVRRSIDPRVAGMVGYRAKDGGAPDEVCRGRRRCVAALPTAPGVYRYFAAYVDAWGAVSTLVQAPHQRVVPKP